MTMVSDRPASRPSWRLAVALLVLDIALTFQNIWPTPGVKWTGGLSVELGACLLLFGALAAWRGRVPRWLVALVAAFSVLLVLGRYAVVTAPALFGRDVNLYWDLRHVPNVIAMLARPASWPLTVAALLAIIAIPGVIFLILRRALREVADVMAERPGRRVLAGLGALLLVLFAAQRLTAPTGEWEGWTEHRLAGILDFPSPVSATYAGQIRTLARQLSGSAAAAIGPSPDLQASLDAVQGADVIVFFVESYGAVAYDRPSMRDELRGARAILADQIAASGRQVVSAFVTSPTFGGGSWLAHISLLSGIDVKDEDTNQILLTQQRETVVSSFKRRGYKTVAVMPGIQTSWPEGNFYKFDQMYGEIQLAYPGPQFGWWAVPDQYSIARMDANELEKADRRPVFVFMPGVTTHTPFSPTAPYQPDWQRILTNDPYPHDQAIAALSVEPDWLDLGPSYTRALEYVYASIGGYLRHRRDRDLVLVVIGDHQPPAMVSGQGASWDVPVHIIASRPDLLARLQRSGFVAGLEPPRAPISRMHTLATTLLDAFSGDARPVGTPAE